MDLKVLLDTPPWDWPRDAAKRVYETLTNPRAKAADRLAAAELAGDFTIINDHLANALMAVVRNAKESNELRAQAAISFGPALEQGELFGFDVPEEVPISETTFDNIRELLHKIYFDTSVPKEIRRRVLESSVRSPQDWHLESIRAAYASGDREWALTAVFSMRWVRGFDDHIMEALESDDPDIHYEAVNAAGDSALQAAWTHVLALVSDRDTPKPLLLAAIGAVGAIHPQEASAILQNLAESEDEEIAEAADEAILLAEPAADDEEEDDEEEEGEGEWLN